MPARLSNKKFINTPATAHITNKNAAAKGDIVTIGVFFDATQTSSTQSVPFWVAVAKKATVAVALDKICGAGNVRNKKTRIVDDSEEELEPEEIWFTFPLTSGTDFSVNEPLDDNLIVEDIAVNGDFWYVGKGPIFPDELVAEASTRVASLLGKKINVPVAAPTTTKDLTPQPIVKTSNKPSTNPKKRNVATTEVVAEQPAPIVHVNPNFMAGVKTSASNTTSSPSLPPTNITINAHFPALGGKIVQIEVLSNALVFDVLKKIKIAEPLETSEGARIMFFEKYLSKLDDNIRAVPLTDGCTVDVCTGKFMCDYEMTLYLAERRMDIVRSALKGHGDGPVADTAKKHWNEQLMKALVLLDSLQDVPEDIRTRRKNAVKVVIEEQDQISSLKSA